MELLPLWKLLFIRENQTTYVFLEYFCYFCNEMHRLHFRSYLKEREAVKMMEEIMNE